eukprot:COSAG01_NODE_1116_length_11642_cov_7.561899_3_plen_110_part_00
MSRIVVLSALIVAITRESVYVSVAQPHSEPSTRQLSMGGHGEGIGTPAFTIRSRPWTMAITALSWAPSRVSKAAPVSPDQSQQSAPKAPYLPRANTHLREGSILQAVMP